MTNWAQVISDWKRGQDWRHPVAGTVCENWIKDLGDGSQLKVLVGQEPKDGDERNLWHLSISVQFKNLVNRHGGAGARIPTFEEIKEARYRFVPDEVNMAMMFPPKRMWISLPNSVVIHLWQVPIECAEQP